MSEQRVGTCSLCGGSVHGHRGAWWGIQPPPPDHCLHCGAVAKTDVIEMQPAPQPPPRRRDSFADRVHVN